MLIWRPLITKVPSDPQGTAKSRPIPFFSDPAIIHCTEAARDCVRIVEVQLRLGIDSFYIPGTITISYVCAGLLLLNAWNQKIWAKESGKYAMPDLKPPLASHIERDIATVKTFMCALEAVKERWDIVDTLLWVLFTCIYCPAGFFRVLLAHLSTHYSRDELKDALDGLGSQPSDEELVLKDSRSRSPPRNVQINMQLRYSPEDEQPQHSQPPSRTENSYHPTWQRKKSQTTLSRSFSESEPGIHITTPGAPGAQLETHRTSDVKSRRSSTDTMSGAADEQSTLTSSTSINPASWRERGIPYISSMRRTSSSNLHARKGLYLPEDEDLSNSRPTLSTPESAVRYNDVTMHSNEGHLGTTHYVDDRCRHQGDHRWIRGPPDIHSTELTISTFPILCLIRHGSNNGHSMDAWLSIMSTDTQSERSFWQTTRKANVCTNRHMF